ncbi:MAG: branched-chain amino acid ABC transporter permease [Anaerolineae bacterium]|nr:branched-chain amino acid ABC transporter permease [Anaerolineae bacterium]
MQDNRLHRRHPLVQFLIDNWFIFALGLVMLLLPNWLSSNFDQPISNLEPRDLRGNEALKWLAVAIDLYILAILAMSYNLLFGFSGIISFGHALFFGSAVYVMIILIGDYRMDVLRSTGVALAVVALLALFTALAAFRIRGVYFAMFTLALAEIFWQLARVNLFRFLTNGDDGLRLSGDQIPAIAENVNRLDLYYVSALAAGLVYLFIRRLMYSPTGKVLLAIRDNEMRAQTMGFNTARYKLLIILISTCLAGLSGVLYSLSAKGAEPTSLGLGRTVDPLIMTIIGGTGTIPGPVVGASVLHLGDVFLNKPDLAVNLDFIVFRYEATVDTREEWALSLGVIFILIVLFIPYGLVGQASTLWVQMRRWMRKYIYDPLVRQFPDLATYAAPFTGEPGELARLVAAQSRPAPLLMWALTYPAAVVWSVVGGLALLAFLFSGSERPALSLILFTLVFISPLLVLHWVFRKRATLLAQVQTFIAQFR